jgi:hypothetical protein
MALPSEQHPWSDYEDNGFCRKSQKLLQSYFNEKTLSIVDD